MGYKKITNYYRTIINIKEVKICDFLNGINQNILLDVIIGVALQSFPSGIIHPCPYHSQLKLYNLWIDPTKYKTILPDGTYRQRFRLYTESDENIFKMTFSNDIFASKAGDW